MYILIQKEVTGQELLIKLKNIEACLFMTFFIICLGNYSNS